MRLQVLLGVALAIGCAPIEPGSSASASSSQSTESVDVRVHVRVVTWNVALLDEPGTEPYQALVDVLRRLDGDVVAINEIAEEERQTFYDLADDLGYDTAFLPETNPFGNWRNAVLSRLPVVSLDAPTSAELSGDPDATDVTRLPIVTTVEIPQTHVELRIVGQHLKAGPEDADRFRRAVDAQRTSQAAQGSQSLIVLGDMNADLALMPQDPPIWTRPPSGIPGHYRLGSDLGARLQGQGLPNDAFAPFLDLGLHPLDAKQLDGRVETRPVSGRRIDWILLSEDLLDRAEYEVYNSLNEQMGGLPKAGNPPARASSELASDHLPVFVDLDFPAH